MSERGVERIEAASAVRRGLVVWYAAFGSIGAWIAHLVYEAAAVQWTVDHPAFEWTMHAATGVCIAATALAMLLAWRLTLIAAHGRESDVDDAGQMLFLGRLGLLVGAINLALIVVEGVYVLAIPHR